MSRRNDMPILCDLDRRACARVDNLRVMCYAERE
jgi:hypothetical protein